MHELGARDLQLANATGAQVEQQFQSIRSSLLGTSDWSGACNVTVGERCLIWLICALMIIVYHLLY